MALYYVTGVSGSGKSAVLAELKRRGHEAYGTDENNLAAHYHTVTGAKAPRDTPVEARTKDWRHYHQWKAPAGKVEALRRKAADKTVFLCGVSANDGEFWDKFTRAFCLYVPPEEIKRRILSRTGNNFGKNPHELNGILEWAAYSKKQYEALGAIIIDATQPIKNVVDDILTASGAQHEDRH
jgi:thymidylate kinase